MAILRVNRSHLKGIIRAPPSKSYTHRAVVASSLAKEISTIDNVLLSDDTEATLDACRKMGAKIEVKDMKVTVEANNFPVAPNDEINCRESGSTMRFLTPIAALASGRVVLSAEGSLKKRPMKPMLDALQRLGVKCVSKFGDGRPPLIIESGGIPGGKTALPGDVSSQFVSGLLFASPLAKETVEISLTTPLESKPYVEMTLNVLKKHGISCQASKNLQNYRIQEGQKYKPYHHKVPGDFSSAAFLLVAAAVTRSEITMECLITKEKQPDQDILEILKKMGAGLSIKENSVTIYPHRLVGVNVDARDCPDLVPIITILGSFAEGETVIIGAGRLRIKESDRLATITAELSKMGACINEFHDSLRINGPTKLLGAEVDSHGDHRIAMACAVAGLGAEGVTKINNSECIKKSYPSFVEDMKHLGAEIV